MTRFRPFVPTILLFGVLAASGAAQQKQATMPDAEVEANVLKALAGSPQLATFMAIPHFGAGFLVDAATRLASCSRMAQASCEAHFRQAFQPIFHVTPVISLRSRSLCIAAIYIYSGSRKSTL